MTSRSAPPAANVELTGISVAYNQTLKPARVKLSRRGRAAARRNLKPFGMSPNRRRVRPSDPSQNNPNDIGAKILPQGQGPL